MTVDALIHQRNERERLVKRNGELKQANNALRGRIHALERLVAEYELAREQKDFELNCYDLENLWRWQAKVEFRQTLDGRRKVTVSRPKRGRPIQHSGFREALDLAEQKWGGARERAGVKKRGK